LQQELQVPVIHDDQHGTTVIVLAGLINSLKLVNKNIQDVRVVVSGAGAVGIASTRLLVSAGVQPANIIVCDRRGAIVVGRDGLNVIKQHIATETNHT